MKLEELPLAAHAFQLFISTLKAGGWTITQNASDCAHVLADAVGIVSPDGSASRQTAEEMQAALQMIARELYIADKGANDLWAGGD